MESEESTGTKQMSKKGGGKNLSEDLLRSLPKSTPLSASLATAGAAIGTAEGPVGVAVGTAFGYVVGCIIDSVLGLFGNSPKVIEEERRRIEKYAQQAQEANQATKRMMQQITTLIEKMDAQLKDQQAKFNEVKQRYHGIMAQPSDAAVRQKMSELGFLDNHFHIAVAGTCGVGKSAFVNAIRGIRDGEAGAAAVGYTETTLNITRYAPSRSEEKSVWYDVPGAGTARVDRWEYFKEQGLYVMDAIILIWADRILDTDQNIIENCAALGIPCFLVRSKCDVIINNLRKDVSRRMNYPDSSDPAYQAALGSEIEAFRERNLIFATKAIKQAYEAVKVPLRTNDFSTRVFRINANSMYKLVTRRVRDEFTLDEEILWVRLAMAIAKVEPL